ncbi:MAG: bifunctional allantoicase/(S)-ureidoglycine aminohydrolase [Pseudomonadota bacterium]
MISRYQSTPAGLPSQHDLMTGRAVFTESYAVIPRGVMRDIVTSALPFWDATFAWVLARPLSGFAETFSQYLVEVAAGGGSDRPETEEGVEAILFVMDGALELVLDGQQHVLSPGAYVYIPPASTWTLHNRGSDPARFMWIRKRYAAVAGMDAPDAFVTREQDIDAEPMPDTNGGWATQRFVRPDDLRHDMHVNIVTFAPGNVIPFEETHVMEHGLFVLEGKAVYKLNRDWVEVEGGDFLWLRAFCPQACYAGGPGRFRYLLYKDVNRHAGFGAGL